MKARNAVAAVILTWAASAVAQGGRSANGATQVEVTVTVGRYGLIDLEQSVMNAFLPPEDIGTSETEQSTPITVRTGGNAQVSLSVPRTVTLLNGIGATLPGEMALVLQTTDQLVGYSPGQQLVYTVKPGLAEFQLSFQVEPPGGTWTAGLAAGVYSGVLTLTVAGSE